MSEISNWIALIVSIFFGITSCGSEIRSYEPSSSRPTPDRTKYTGTLETVSLSPLDYQISIPSNHLWFIHANMIRKGIPETNKYIGKRWITAEVRFLLPSLDVRTQKNELLFRSNNGENLLSATITSSLSGNGDTRRKWKSVNLITDEGTRSTATEAAIAAGAKPPEAHDYHQDLDLYEYIVDDGHGSRYFISGDVIIHCWRKLFSVPPYVCESSFNLNEHLIVNYAFPYEHLSGWRKINRFIRDTTRMYKIAYSPST